MKRAITRKVSKSFRFCVSDHPFHPSISIRKATKQHNKYVRLLRELGIEVIVLDPLVNYPDSCFVEDTAVIQNGKVMITRMGEETRRGEEKSIYMIINDYFSKDKIKTISYPGTLEGGDVMHFQDMLISGNTIRTNENGISQLEEWIKQPVHIIQDKSIVHLKSYVTSISNDLIITTSQYADHPTLRQFERIVVPKDEFYAANTLTIGEVVILPTGYPKTAKLIEDKGYDTEPIEMSEFEKCQGAISCLSLIF